MMASVIKTDLALLAVAVVGVLLIRKYATEIGTTVGTAAVETVKDATAGVAVGIGDAIGVPRTNETECQAAMRDGRTWDASFACPASTFIDYTIHGYHVDTSNKGLQ